jgi:hypothetical protein
MSYTEKHENISKDEWMNRLEGLHIQRADMNKLIMNYLVTGKQSNTSFEHRMWYQYLLVT